MVRHAMPIPEEMIELRRQIDAVDDKLVALLAERFRIARIVADCKHRANIPARLPSRIERVIKRSEANARQADLPQNVASKLWTLLVEETCQFEEGLLAAKALGANRIHINPESHTGGNDEHCSDETEAERRRQRVAQS